MEVAQQREEIFSLSYPSTINKYALSDISTSVCDRSTETTPPFQSVSPVAKLSKEDFFLSLTSEDHNKEKYDTYQYTGQKAIHDSDSLSVTTTLPSSPEQVTSERADAAEAMDLESLARSKLLSIMDEFTTTSSTMRKKKIESEKTNRKPCQKGKYPSVTVIIPPLRSRTIGSPRSSSQAVSSDMSLSKSSERSDDLSEEDFIRDNL